MSSGNAALMGEGSGSKAISFADNKGVWVVGTVTAEPTSSQEKAPNGELKTYDNGDPRMHIVVELATNYRNPEIDEDDGSRRLFIKSLMKPAVRDAVLAAGAAGLEIGGQLAIRWFDDKPPTVRGNNPTKVYEAKYKKAPAQANTDLMGADPFGGPAPVVSTATGAPVVHQQAVPQMTPAQYADPAPAGVDPQIWASMGKEQRDGVRALLGGGNAAPVQRDEPPF